MLGAHDISKRYRTGRGSIVALSHASVELQAGITTLIGANGSGKSTLIRILAAIEKPTEGFITLDGKKPQFNHYRAQVGYVPQDVRFVTGMKVKQALEYSGWVAGMSRAAYSRRIGEVLDLVTTLPRWGIIRWTKPPPRNRSGVNEQATGSYP